MSARQNTSSPTKGRARLDIFSASDLDVLVAPVLDQDLALHTSWAALSADGRDNYRYGEAAAMPYVVGLELFNAFVEDEAYL